MGKASSANSPIETENEKRRILIIGDDLDTLNLFQDALQLYGFITDAYSNPDGALDAF